MPKRWPHTAPGAAANVFVLLPRLLQAGGDPALDADGVHGAGLALDFSAAHEQDQRGDAADVEALAEGGFVLGVDLGEAHGGHGGGGLGEGRGHHLAGAAPWRPEVHHHRNVVARDVLLGVVYCQPHWLAAEQRLVALAAIGRVGQAAGRYAVGGGAVRTDQVQGGGGVHGRLPMVMAGRWVRVGRLSSTATAVRFALAQVASGWGLLLRQLASKLWLSCKAKLRSRT